MVKRLSGACEQILNGDEVGMLLRVIQALFKETLEAVIKLVQEELSRLQDKGERLVRALLSILLDNLGTYPKVSLSAARKKAEDVRKLLYEGHDPSGHRKAAKEVVTQQRIAEKRAAAGLPSENSFEAVAREWYAKNAPRWAETHSSKILARLERDVFPWIGSRPVNEIQPLDVLALLKRVEERGAIETTHRVQQNCGQVFRYAVVTGRAQSDPSRDLRGALTPWKPEH
jgi:hypothetical protein